MVQEAFGWLWLLPWVLALAYICECVIAIPLHLELKRRGRVDWLAYGAVGVITGVVPFAVYGLLPLLAKRGAFRVPRAEELVWCGLGATAGLGAATAFWLIAVRPFRGDPR